ncbi:MAG: pantetheine-phosphate adenylyltransferase [Pseudomonadota bacterium]|nr:pantetheine-phosphate adenylyltransferase [Pseudomonadota bacterium]
MEKEAGSVTPRVAVYAGSFDPVTHGHLDVIRRGTKLFDEVIVAIGHNVRKERTLPLAVREQVLRDSTSDIPGVRVDVFEGLLVNYCRRVGAGAILRGLRAVTDFEFEFQIGLANMDMAPDIETVFLLTDPRNIFVSSSLVKEIASNGGDVTRYLPEAALAALEAARPR